MMPSAMLGATAALMRCHSVGLGASGSAVSRAMVSGDNLAARSLTPWLGTRAVARTTMSAATSTIFPVRVSTPRTLTLPSSWKTLETRPLR